METHIKIKGNYTVIHIVSDNVDPDEKDLLAKTIRDHTAKENYVALNLSKLNYVNSQLLSVFLHAYKAMERKKGQFVLVHPTKRVNDLLRITALDKILTVYQDEKTFEQIA